MHESKHLLKKLKKRGWEKEALDLAQVIFSEHKDHHAIFPKKIDNYLHIFLFGLILLLNGFAFTTMLPIIIVMPLWFSIVVLSILGLGLGSVCSVVINDLTHLKHHHHMFFYLIIPAATIVTFLGIMYVFQRAFFYILFTEPVLISISYMLGFLIPFLLLGVKNHFDSKE